MNHHRAVLSLVLPALVLLFAAPGQAGPSREEVLPNGLRVVLIEHHANPMVCASVVVGAGVVHEPSEAGGASHLLEHMLFNGTGTRTQRQLYDDADRIGAYNNATTREDHTLFTLLVQKEYAAEGLALQADMLFGSTLPAENFEKEKGIVLEEMARDRGDPGYGAGEAFRRFAWAGTPLARPVLGTEDAIRNASRDQAYAYYRARYVPANMVLVVMGDFEPGPMLDLVRKTYGAAPAGKPPKDTGSWPARPAANLQTGPVEAERVYLHAGFPLPFGPHDPRMAAVELLLSALADGDDAPLASLAQGADPAVQGFSLGVARRSAPWSTVEFSATLPKGKPFEPVLAALADGLRSLGAGRPARGRVDQVAGREEARAILESDQIHYYVLTRSDLVLGAPAGALARAGQRWSGIHEARLDDAAALLARGVDDLRISVSGPGLPAASSNWTPPPAPAAPPAPATRLETVLPSGMEVLLERSDDSPVFALHLMLRPRSASEPEGKGGIASFLHRLMPRGTTSLDAAALSARLDELGATIKTDDDPSVPFDDYYTVPDFSFVRLEMPAARWREGIGLLADVVRHPRLASDDVEAVRKEMLDLHAKKAEGTRARAAALMDARLAPGHPSTHPVLGTSDSVRAITADDLRAFHAGYVTGKRILLTGVVPVDLAQVEAAIAASFGDLAPGANLPERPAAPRVRPETIEPVRETSGGKGPATILVSGLWNDLPAPSVPAALVAFSLISDRLSFRLREEKGLAYAMGASLFPWAGTWRWQVSMTTRAGNVDTALEELQQAFLLLAQDPPDEAAVKRAANALRGRLLMRRLMRVSQAYGLGLERLEGRPWGDDRARLDALLKVTAQDLRNLLPDGICTSRSGNGPEGLHEGPCTTVIVQ